MSAGDDMQVADPVLSCSSVCGLDWAAQPPGRAAAVLSACGDSLRLVSVVTGVSDSAAVQLCRDPAFAAVGVDSPFGWPSEFTRFLTGWRTNGGAMAPPAVEAFRYRVTDRMVRNRLGKHPLSVSSDLISLAARSWVTLVQNAGLGSQVDCGLQHPPCSGPAIIEVYPGATLAAICGARPSVRSDGYKKDAAVRRGLLDALVAEFHLELCGKAEAVIGTGPRCDAFDALIAALTAAVYTGRVTDWSICRPAPSLDHDTLRQEGWIYFPVPGPASPMVEPDPTTAPGAASGGGIEQAPVSRTAAGIPPATPEWAPDATPVLDPEGLSAADVVNCRVLCPACRDHIFQRWPSGWDAHSHRCSGLAASTHANRKAEFKTRYRHLFR